MGERRDLRDLLKDTDFTQKRIIDDLANSDTETDYPERGVAGDIKKSEGGDFIKNIFVGLLLVGIVVGSFWISFLIGKKVLVPPIKNLPTFEIPAPKPISKLEIEKATLVKEEPVIKEREINAAQVKAKLPKPIEVNKALTAKKVNLAKTAAVMPAIKTPIAKTTGMKYYKVIIGTYKTAAEANDLVRSLKEKGFQSYVKKLMGLYRVQAGAFDKKEKAGPLVVKLKNKGFIPTIIVE
jgi:N-acetylmuramoyl-L-alanine amidase